MRALGVVCVGSDIQLSYGAGEFGQWVVAHLVKGCKYSIKLRRTGKKLTSLEAAEKAARGVSYVFYQIVFHKNR